MLSAEQRASWERDGYLAIRGFFAEAEIDRITALVEGIFRDPPAYLIVDNTATGVRSRLADLPAEQRSPRLFKLNDLFLEHPELRDVALGGRVRPILAGLLGEPAVLCNSLNFEKGSQQPQHIDSLYMTPQTPGRLVATWIALEDAHPDAGQLFYYPGSHRLPLHTFSDGTHHAIDGEVAGWRESISAQVAAAGLPRLQFPAMKGDLFIWHANLLHGGSPILDPQRTRKSLVCHYYGLADCRKLGYDCIPAGGDGYWVKRAHPPLPAPPTPVQRVKRWFRRTSFGRMVKKWIRPAVGAGGR